MDYTTVTNPVYASADKTQIRCMVLFDGMDAPVPFVAHAADPEDHGRELFSELNSLAFGPIGNYVAPVPTPAEQYTAAIALGLSLVSGSTPSLNAVYSVTSMDQNDIIGEVQNIQILSAFTDGNQTFGWPDATGVRHTFPSTDSFVQFAKATAVYVSGCKQAMASIAAGGAADFPSNVAMIG